VGNIITVNPESVKVLLFSIVNLSKSIQIADLDISAIGLIFVLST